MRHLLLLMLLLAGMCPESARADHRVDPRAPGAAAAVDRYAHQLAIDETSNGVIVTYTGVRRYPHSHFALSFAQTRKNQVNDVVVPVVAHQCPGPYYVVHLIGERVDCIWRFTDVIPAGTEWP
jgi:hypothetical protein